VTPTLDELLFVEEDRETLELLAEIALLAPTGAAELARIRGTSTRAMAAVLGDLLTRGLAQGPPGGRGPGSAGRIGLAPLVHRAVIDELVARDGRDAGVIVEVVEGLRGVGEVHRALTALAEIGASRPVADLLAEHGAALVDAGRAPAVARACEIVVDADRTANLEAVHARALASHGELAGALDRVAAGLERATGATDGTRLHLHVLAAQMHLLRGELPSVIAVSREGDDPERQDPDAVQLRAARAQAHLRRGELDDASSVAQVCLGAAERDGGAAVLALAHRVLADLASAEGRRDDHERHHRRAYAAAERSGAASELVQVRVQRGVHHLARGRTTEALFELDRALAATSSSVLDAGRAAVLTARAEVSLRTGRVHAAAQDAEAARSVYDRLGSREARGPLHLLGDVHRERGDLEAAREAYGRALALADPDGDARAALAATIGMARCATDVDEARRTADRALELPGGPVCAGAHLAAAWAALAGGARDDARDHAERAARVAAERHDERGAVEASTLLAVLGDEPVDGLRRAARAWHRVHDPLWATRTELALARRSERADDRSRAGDLERRLARLGSVVDGGEVAHRQLVAPGAGGPVELRLLGGFEVLVEGRAVTDQLASDDEARRVLQVVAVAAGRSVAREELVRALWPDAAPADATRRLDEAIARVRGLLRHHERWTAPIVGDATALRLRVESIGVDLSIFERSGELGLRAVREGHPREADALLRTALAAHGGELLAGEPSTDWAAARRRAVRRLADEVHRALATLQPRDTGGEG
jgi:tetratricopeptide (TPR) repeat protein